MDSLISTLVEESNGMILLVSDESSLNESSGGKIPCNRVLAQTPWKRQRDDLLFGFLQKFIKDDQKKPVVVFTNSVVEVTLFASTLRHRLPHLQDGITAIGTNMSPSTLHTEVSTIDRDSLKVLVLSSQMALAAFVHGIVRIQDFSAMIFADARGANQNHPFCVIMNHFYTPARFNGLLLPRIIGFTELKPIQQIELDMFSRRDWIKTLHHYTHTFNCIPMALDPTCPSIYLESFDRDQGRLFDCLSIYESIKDSTTDLAVTDNAPLLIDSLSVPKNACASLVVLKHDTVCDEIPQLMALLQSLKASGVKRLVHIHRNATPQFTAKLSLFSCLHSLNSAASTSERLDHMLAQEICNEATNLFSQSDHLLSCSKGFPTLRNANTGSLLIESTAIPILVRCCALLGREFRQSVAGETVQFKTIRVFAVNEKGVRQTTHPNHLSLLKLPLFFYDRIKDSIPSQLKPSVEVDKFHLQGPLCSSRHHAQCSAAYQAALLLADAGILDDHLLLASEFRESDQVAMQETDESLESTGIEEEDAEGSSQPDVSFDELIPRALIKSDSTRVLHVYAMEYELCMYRTEEDLFCADPDPVLLTPYSRLLLSSTPSMDFFSTSKSNRAWAVLLPSELPEGFVPVEIPIGTDHYLRVELRRIDEISLESSQYSRLLDAQQSLFGMFNMKPITVKTEDDLLSKSVRVETPIVPEDKMPFYLISPLCDENGSAEDLNSIEAIPRVWDLFVAFVEAFERGPLEGSFYHLTRRESGSDNEQRHWRIDWKFVDACVEPQQCLNDYLVALDEFLGTKPGDLGVLLEEGGVVVNFRRFALERLSFFTPHTKIFYRPNRPLPDRVYPTSPFTSPAFPAVTTHAEYLAARYSLHVRDLESEMLAVRRVENWSDLAVWISEDGASKKRRRKTNKTGKMTPVTDSSGTCIASDTTIESSANSTSSFIAPEFAKIFPCEYSFFRVAMLLPRVSFEIERQLRIAEFFDVVGGGVELSHARKVEALTASTAALSYSYEQLEVLGDSFLKYYSTLDTLLVGTGWSEGRLSSHRQRILCNANLRTAAERLNITTYASFTPFFSKLWCPPPLQITSNAALNESVNRVLFDPQHRWRALAGVQGKRIQKQAVYLLDPHGSLSIDSSYKTKEQLKNSTDSIYKYGQLVPPKALADMLEALIGIYYIDGGVQGCLKFLVSCGVLQQEILVIRQLDPLTVAVGAGHQEMVEKIKRRKMTPINSIVLEGNNYNYSSCIPVIADAIKNANAIDCPVAQKIENVLPSATPFAQFPFEALEAKLHRQPFTDRQLLFMACTHSSLDSKVNNERLEWIGDAAIDWLVCRHYWYNCRFKEEGNVKGSSVSNDASNLTIDCTVENLDLNHLSPSPLNGSPNLSHSSPTPTPLLSHPCNPHVPVGFLPLSPESLTNARQSAINNESFARLVVRFGLQRFLRINSPHLQMEIDRFCEEIKSIIGIESDDLVIPSQSSINTPEVLKNLHTHVSVAAPKVLGDLFEALMGALLLDTRFDIDGFAASFQPFLEACCADPADLPTNAIQETLHIYARMGIPRNQIVCTYREVSSTSTLGVICQVWVRERCVAEAEGSNKGVAKKLAMQRALDALMAKEREKNYE